MKPFRASIAALLGLIAMTAVGLMGLREGKPLWASLSFVLTLVFLVGATLTTLIHSARERPGWAGFALLGWVYLGLSFGPWADLAPPPMPGAWLVERSLERLHPEPEYEPVTDASGLNVRLAYTIASVRYAGDVQRLKPGSVVWTGENAAFRQTAHAMLALLCGMIGAAWGRWLSGSGAGRAGPPAPPSAPSENAT